LHLFVPDSTTAPNTANDEHDIPTIELVLPIYPTYTHCFFRQEWIRSGKSLRRRRMSRPAPNEHSQ
jgi:hypothetical protein